MSTKKMTLTPRETELIALAWQCLTTEPKVSTSSDDALKISGICH